MGAFSARSGKTATTTIGQMKDIADTHEREDIARPESERSSARLEHLVWDQDVAGSNPVAPTILWTPKPQRQDGAAEAVGASDRSRQSAPETRLDPPNPGWAFTNCHQPGQRVISRGETAWIV